MISEDYSGVIVTQSDWGPDTTPSPPNSIWLRIDFVSSGRLTRAKEVHCHFSQFALVVAGVCVSWACVRADLLERKEGSLEEGKESVRGVDRSYWREDCFACAVHVCNHVFGSVLEASLLANRWALSCCVLLVLTQRCLRKSMFLVYVCSTFFFCIFTPTTSSSPPARSSIPPILALILPLDVYIPPATPSSVIPA